MDSTTCVICNGRGVVLKLTINGSSRQEQWLPCPVCARRYLHDDDLREIAREAGMTREACAEALGLFPRLVCEEAEDRVPIAEARAALAECLATKPPAPSDPDDEHATPPEPGHT